MIILHAPSKVQLDINSHSHTAEEHLFVLVDNPVRRVSSLKNSCFINQLGLDLHHNRFYDHAEMENKEVVIWDGYLTTDTTQPVSDLGKAAAERWNPTGKKNPGVKLDGIAYVWNEVLQLFRPNTHTALFSLNTLIDLRICWQILML